MKTSPILTFALSATTLFFAACGEETDPAQALFERIRTERDETRREFLSDYISQFKRARAGERFNADAALAYSVIFGYPEHVRFFLAEGADANAAFGGEPLLAVALFDVPNFEIAELLLKDGADASSSGLLSRLIASDVPATDAAGGNAAAAQRERFIKLLLDNGADPNACDADGLSALAAAATKKDLKTAELLLDLGASPDAGTRGNGRRRPLIEATLRGDRNMMELLLSRGADVNAEYRGATALSVAVTQKNYPLAEFLIAQGADVRSPELVAFFIKKANAPALKYLFENKADPNAKIGGVPAIAVAAKDGNAEIVKQLAESGADATPALPYFVQTLDAENVRLLLTLKADANALVGEEPAVAFAARNGNAEIVKLLVESGADATPALPYFIQAQDAENVRWLLARKANANALIGEEPVVAFAARGGNAEIVKLLVNSGADATPALPYFVRKKDVETVEFLRRRNADASGVEDAEPLIVVAAKNKDVSMVELLVKRGANASLALPYFTGAQDVKTMSDLLRNGADPRAVVNGVPVIVSVAESGNFDLVRLLADSGADASLALPIFVRKNNEAAVAYLLERNANVNALVDGEPLISVAARGGNAEIVKKLVNYGADASLALPYFTDAKDSETAAYLLARGANPNVADGNGVPVIVSAARKGNIALVEKLIGSGADASLALAEFVGKQNFRMVDDLLKRNVSPNVRVDGVPAVVFAAREGNVALVTRLAEAGADASLALPYFVKSRNMNMVAVLLERNADPNTLSLGISPVAPAPKSEAAPQPEPPKASPEPAEVRAADPVPSPSAGGNSGTPAEKTAGTEKSGTPAGTTGGASAGTTNRASTATDAGTGTTKPVGTGGRRGNPRRNTIRRVND